MFKCVSCGYTGGFMKRRIKSGFVYNFDEIRSDDIGEAPENVYDGIMCPKCNSEYGINKPNSVIDLLDISNLSKEKKQRIIDEIALQAEEAIFEMESAVTNEEIANRMPLVMGRLDNIKKLVTTMTSDDTFEIDEACNNEQDLKILIEKVVKRG